MTIWNGSLWPKERQMINNAKVGKPTIFGNTSDAPKTGANWPRDRTIRAEVLAALLTGEGGWPVHRKGVMVAGAKIEGELDLYGAQISSNMQLKRCHFTSRVILQDASTKGLFFNGSAFNTGDYKDAFNADRLKVDGSLHLHNVVAVGKVRLAGALVGGDLSCIGARFANYNKDGRGIAFVADEVTVRGNLSFAGAKAVGQVRLLGAQLGGQLNCTGARFANYTRDGEGEAFVADGLTIKNGLFFDGVNAVGQVRLAGAQIGGQLSCDGARFANRSGTAFIGQRMVCEGGFFFRPTAVAGHVVLVHSRVGELIDNLASWPSVDKGGIDLEGFVYGAFAGNDQPDADSRIKWLEKRPNSYHPQPYEQLAKVFRDMGHEGDARKVLIAKQRAHLVDRKENRPLKFWEAGWWWFLGWTTNFGYHPQKALIHMGFLLGFALMLFDQAYIYGYMAPAKDRIIESACYDVLTDDCKTWQPFERQWASPINLPGDYTEFHPFVYAVDVFIPIVDLHQETYWEPRSDGFWGGVLRLYYWFYIAAGWVLTTLAVAGFTGLIRARVEK